MPGAMRPSVHCVIVSHNLHAMLRLCLCHWREALRTAEVTKGTVAVIDNASAIPITPAIVDDAHVQILRFDGHHSFAESCNRGVAGTEADLLLFLNNDVLLDRGAIGSMVREFEGNARVGICGTRMVFHTGLLQHAGVVFGAEDVGPYHWQRTVPTELVPRDRARFQAVTGAALMIRRGLFHELGGFDTAFSFGLEDIDLCLRAGQLGWSVHCRQDSDSLHFESMTPGRVELDPPSRRHFMEKWKGRYTIDG